MTQRNEGRERLGWLHFPVQEDKASEILCKDISMTPTMFQRLKQLLYFPLRLLLKKEEKKNYIEVIKILEYLLGKKAYLKRSLLFYVDENENENKKETKRNREKRVMKKYKNIKKDISSYTEGEIFAYLKEQTTKRLAFFLSQRMSVRLINHPLLETEIPFLIQSMALDRNPYRLYALQLLIRLFVAIKVHTHINYVSESTAISKFVPLLMGASVKEIKEKDSVKYQDLLNKWQRIMQYLPRERLIK